MEAQEMLGTQSLDDKGGINEPSRGIYICLGLGWLWIVKGQRWDPGRPLERPEKEWKSISGVPEPKQSA